MPYCQTVYFFPFHTLGACVGVFCARVFVLTKLPLSSQWVTRWPPQDQGSVSVVTAQRGGSGSGAWASFNTRHIWVVLWTCCCYPPKAASSDCPASKLIRLTVTRMSRGYWICLILFLCVSARLPLSFITVICSLSLSLWLQKLRIQHTRASGTGGLRPVWKGLFAVFV